MIGRGAVGNPFIFQEIIAELSGQTPASNTPQKRLAIYQALIEENVAYYGERIGINRSRKTAGYWIKDFPNAAEVRGKFVRLETLSDIQKLFASSFPTQNL
jgi:tRNA-dihydrouridine synthase B